MQQRLRHMGTANFKSNGNTKINGNTNATLIYISLILVKSLNKMNLFTLSTARKSKCRTRRH